MYMYKCVGSRLFIYVARCAAGRYVRAIKCKIILRGMDGIEAL